MFLALGVIGPLCSLPTLAADGSEHSPGPGTCQGVPLPLFVAQLSDALNSEKNEFCERTDPVYLTEVGGVGSDMRWCNTIIAGAPGFIVFNKAVANAPSRICHGVSITSYAKKVEAALYASDAKQFCNQEPGSPLNGEWCNHRYSPGYFLFSTIRLTKVEAFDGQWELHFNMKNVVELQGAPEESEDSHLRPITPYLNKQVSFTVTCENDSWLLEPGFNSASWPVRANRLSTYLFPTQK